MQIVMDRLVTIHVVKWNVNLVIWKMCYTCTTESLEIIWNNGQSYIFRIWFRQVNNPDKTSMLAIPLTVPPLSLPSYMYVATIYSSRQHTVYNRISISMRALGVNGVCS